MKKTIGVLAVLFLCFLFFGQAWADQTAEALSKTKVVITEDDHSQVESFEKRQWPLATGPSTFVGTPFSQLQKGKWFIFWTELDKSLTLENIEMMRKKTRVEEVVLFKWLKRHIRVALREKPIKRPAKAIEGQKFPLPESAPLQLLNWDPEKICHDGDKEIGEAVLTGDYSWQPWPFSAILGAAVDEAMKETNTRRVVVYLRFKEEVEANGLAIGTNGAAAKTMGPAGQAVDNIAGVLNVGAMIGTTSLSMKDIAEMRIRCLNDGPVDAPKLPEPPKPSALEKELEDLKKGLEDLKAKKPEVLRIELITPPPVAAPPPPPSEPKVEELPYFTVYFDFDKFFIRKDQEPKIEKTAKWVKEHPEFILQSEGHACNIGSVDYNAKLARKRSKTIYDKMIELGVPKEQLRQFVSLSEDRPASERLEENRRVILRVIGPASGN